jgi:hypothetical protein
MTVALNDAEKQSAAEAAAVVKMICYVDSAVTIADTFADTGPFVLPACQALAAVPHHHMC